MAPPSSLRATAVQELLLRRFGARQDLPPELQHEQRKNDEHADERDGEGHRRVDRGVVGDGAEVVGGRPQVLDGAVEQSHSSLVGCMEAVWDY